MCRGAKDAFPVEFMLGRVFTFAVRALLSRKEGHIIDGIWKTENYHSHGPSKWIKFKKDKHE
jgi:hypothetical protein